MRSDSPVRALVLAALLAAAAPGCETAAPAAARDVPGGAADELGCAGSACDAGGEPVRIRIRNDGDADFVLVVVSDARGDRTCVLGGLAAGATSGWCRSADFYRYFPVTVVVDCERHEIHPIDYVGESLLPPGDYTVPLSYSPAVGLELGPPERLAGAD